MKIGTDCKLCSELPVGEAYECDVAGLQMETAPVQEQLTCQVVYAVGCVTERCKFSG